MAKIKILPFELANQIAAGEVIERPASVVKELLENALDAQATEINIEIEAGGISKIKISDNGIGILKDDLPLAVYAHATSKIASITDLFNTRTLGFRGEALASIASISKLSLISRTACQEHAYEYTNFSLDNELQPLSRVVGTTVIVQDLFYNVPVRKKFLKSLKTEYQAIENVIKRFALSESKIGVLLKNDNKLVLDLKKCTSEKDFNLRLQKIQGKTFSDNALYFKNACANIQIEGWISSPKYQRNQNDKIYFYINKRMVKDRLLNNALIQAYDDLLFPGKYPACVVYINLLPQDVDVNIHPQKHEVKFRDPRTVHDLITVAIKDALTKFINTIDNTTERVGFVPEKNNFIASLYKNDLPTKVATFSQEKEKTDDSNDEFQFRINSYIAPVIKKWTVLNKRFAIILLDTKSYLIDIEKFIHFRFFKTLKNAKGFLQNRSLLVPVSLEVDPKTLEKVEKYKEWLKYFGYEITPLGKSNIIIRTINNELDELDFKVLFTKLKKINVTSCEELAQILVSSIKINLLVLSFEEQKELFDSVYQEMELNKVNNYSISMDVDLCCNLLRNYKVVV